MRTMSRNVVFGHRIVEAGTPESALASFGLTPGDLDAAEAYLVEETNAPPAIEKLKLAELQELAQTRGVEVPEDATRKQIIAALEEAGESKG